MYACRHAYMYTCMHVCMHVCMREYINCMHMSICMYANTHEGCLASGDLGVQVCAIREVLHTWPELCSATNYYVLFIAPECLF